jgi:hypothetical protein
VTKDVTWPLTFKELNDRGYIGPGRDFVLGFDEATGESIRMPGLTSLGIGGGQGFGKTTTAHLVMLEAVAKYNGRVRFLVIDPHLGVAGDETLYSKVKGLEPFFMSYFTLPNPVGLIGAEEQVASWIAVWADQFNYRMRGGTGDMWVLVIDEGAAVFDSEVGRSVSKLIEDINRQARKVNMFSIVISQEWRASRMGGTEGRNAIVSFLLHNMTEATAELLVPSDVARQCARLKKGEVILYTEGTDKRGMVPLAEVGDADAVVDLYRPCPCPPMPDLAPNPLNGGRSSGLD